jgi:hypothetical protein
MSNTLVAYNHINGDDVLLYLIPNDRITEQMREWLDMAHDDNNVSSSSSEDDWNNLSAILNEFKMDMSKPRNNVALDIDHIYTGGFFTD